MEVPKNLAELSKCRRRRLMRRTIAIACAVVCVLAASIAAAQQGVGPGESQKHIKPGEQQLPRMDSVDDEEEEEDDASGHQEREDSDGSGEASNQESDREWVQEFDSVDVERIDPEEYSETAQPGGETGIRTEGDELPRAAEQEELRTVVERIERQVVQVVAVQTPPSPYRADPMAFYGHGLWAQPSDDDTPRLITAMSWLEDADEVFVIPHRVAHSSRDRSEWQDVHRRSLESVSAGDGTDAWLDDNEDKLIPVEAERPDEHKNLVTLSASSDRLEPPSEGMELFDPDDESLFRAYGYTPYFGASLVATTILPDHPEQRMLAFYWQTTFPAILGAPLLTEEGELVAINTFRHPHREDVFLSIPSDAVAAYLDKKTAAAE